jgi:prepilin-type N-terminal cleavage/methylation domain-containing protein
MNSQKERGFTIVELLLALSLLSFIMVFALVILTQLIATYNKSLTLTQINQAIRQLDNDVAKGLRFVSPATFKAYQFGRDGGQIQYADDRVIAWSHADYVIVGDKGEGECFAPKMCPIFGI